MLHGCAKKYMNETLDDVVKGIIMIVMYKFQEYRFVKVSLHLHCFLLFLSN